MNKCSHCGGIHETTCPRVKAIDYHPDGTVKRVEFHAPEPIQNIDFSRMLIGGCGGTALYREIGGLDRLVILGDVPNQPGMVIVGRDGEDYVRYPELRWRVPRDELVPMDETPAERAMRTGICYP